MIEISEMSSFLKAEMATLHELMKNNRIDGAIFFCVDIESRVSGLLEKAQEILENGCSV